MIKILFFFYLKDSLLGIHDTRLGLNLIIIYNIRPVLDMGMGKEMSFGYKYKEESPDPYPISCHPYTSPPLFNNRMFLSKPIRTTANHQYQLTSHILLSSFPSFSFLLPLQNTTQHHHHFAPRLGPYILDPQTSQP